MAKGKKITCAECGAPMTLRDSQYGRFYGCTRFPDCRGTHGAHQTTGQPLGTPANKQTKRARIRAHAAFDVIWQQGYMPHTAAYRWLRKQLGLQKAECHIGLFDIAKCERVVALCERYARLNDVIKGREKKDAV